MRGLVAFNFADVISALAQANFQLTAIFIAAFYVDHAAFIHVEIFKFDHAFLAETVVIRVGQYDPLAANQPEHYLQQRQAEEQRLGSAAFFS